MENKPPSDGTQPIVVTPAGVAKPVTPQAPPPPPPPTMLPPPVAVTPVPPPSGNNSPPPTWKPIVLDDIEAPSFDHGHGPSFLLLIRRTLAFLVDTAGVGFFFALFGYDAMKAGRLPISLDEHGFIELVSLALGAALLLLFVFEALTGTSIGKLLFGLHVRRTSGERAGLKQIFWRNLFRIVEFVIIPVAVVMILVLRHRQRIGDKVSDTTVGRSPIGPFAPVSGLLIVAGLAWLVVTYAGGTETLKSFGAQAQPYATDLYDRVVAKVTSTFHLQTANAVSPPATQAVQPQASPAPSSAPSAAASTQPSPAATPA